jgi:hypothetical protein
MNTANTPTPPRSLGPHRKNLLRTVMLLGLAAGVDAMTPAQKKSPAQPLASAVQQAKKDTAKKDTAKPAPPPPEDSILRTYQWRSIGPTLSEGRLVDIAIPDPPPGIPGGPGSVVYAASGAGGIWKSVNGGLSWKPIFDREAVLSISCMLVAPSAPNVIWVGTGDSRGQPGKGVYISRDAGATWQNVGFKKQKSIGQIAVDRNNAEIAYVAIPGAQTKMDLERGLYRTEDGGKSWTRLLWVDAYSGVDDVTIDPFDSHTVYATSSYKGPRQTEKKNPTLDSLRKAPAIWKSTDDGKTWRMTMQGIPLTNADMGSINVAPSPVRRGLIYANVSGGYRPTGPSVSGIYRSYDGGATWQQGATSSQGRIYPSPMDPARLYTTGRGVFYSADEGRTVTQLSGFEGNRAVGDAHVDVVALWLNPRNPNHVVFGGDAGMWFSYDNGASWSSLETLPLGEFYTVAVDNRVPYHVYGGTQDNSLWSVPSRTRKELGIMKTDTYDYGGGDTFGVLADMLDTNTVYMQAPEPWDNIRFDHRNGTFRNITVFGHGGLIGQHGTNGSFLTISPHDHNTIYTTSSVVLRSRDRGESWTAISDTLTSPDTTKIPGAAKPYINHENLAVLRESPVQKGLLWTVSPKGALYLSRDDGAKWTNIRSLIPFIPKKPKDPDAPFSTGLHVADLIPSRYAAGTAYVVMTESQVYGSGSSEETQPHLMRTTDFGQTWKSITGDLPKDEMLRNFVEHHRNPKLLFVGTERGVYFTVDGGTNWRRLRNGLPNIRVAAIALQERENDLAISTFGRGLYILDDLAGLEGLARAEDKKKATLFPVRAATAFLTRDYFFAFPSAHSAIMQNPPYGATINYYIPIGTAPGQVKLTILDRTGKPLRDLDAPSTAGLQRVVWDLRTALPENSLTSDGKPPYSGIPHPLNILVPPGEYRVRLVVGKGEPMEESIRVLSDPSNPASQAAQDKLFADRVMLTEAQARYMNVGKAVNLALEEIKEAQEAIKKYSGPPALVTLADSTKTFADSLYAHVPQGMMSMAGTYAQLLDLLRNAVEPLSDFQRAAYEKELKKEEKAVLDLRMLLDMKLPDLRAALDRAGIPWTRNRVVK